uniref:Glycosyl hydrolases family 22 (GH22) domain-containing protein n=1 Tax=Anopheles christyi TaxID=43041 RepID=A0A240PLP5_9DIPT
MKLYFIVTVIALLGTSNGKIFTKCELARLLAQNGIPGVVLPDWMCLVQHESGFNTAALNTKNSNGSRDYGIFQINNRFWCAEGRAGANECKLQCSSLRDDNILDDINCAKLIYSRHGFNAWAAWRDKCRMKPKPSVKECFKKR